MIQVDTTQGRRDVTHTPSELYQLERHIITSELTQALDHLREALTAAEELGSHGAEGALIAQAIAHVEEVLA